MPLWFPYLVLLIFGLTSLGIGLLYDRFVFRRRLDSHLRARFVGIACGALIFGACYALFIASFPYGIIVGLTATVAISFILACLLNSLSLWRLWRASQKPGVREVFG